MKTLRRISRKTHLDSGRSVNILSTCNVEDINNNNNLVLRRKKEWNEHINKMEDRRIVRIARDESPLGHRSVGCHRNSWSDNLIAE